MNLTKENRSLGEVDALENDLKVSAKCVWDSLLASSPVSFESQMSVIKIIREKIIMRVDISSSSRCSASWAAEEIVRKGLF